MRTACVVVGAGHAGLAASRYLTALSIDHVVLERGEVANTWRTERWDSLRLLTPNWQCRLPGFAYAGPDPDGFLTMPEVVGFIDRYAETITAPVRAHTTVESVRPARDGYEVVTDHGTWQAPTVMLASGGFNLPKVPELAEAVPGEVAQVTPLDYKRPGYLAAGGVLVVGAAATGIQIAEEVHASGRPVTLAVGEHVRMPRVYRGRDVQWWMGRSGRADERWDEVDDLVRARRVASPQLVGTPERRTLDLNALTAQGVRLVGRVAGLAGTTLQLSGSLRNTVALADLKLTRLLDTFDEWAVKSGADADLPPPERHEPIVVDGDPPLGIDLASGEIRTIIWATGYEADYSWLDVPGVLDHRGRLRHDGGVVTGAPGLYRIGLNFLRRRKSSFIHGADDDARELVDHLASYLGVGTGRHAAGL